MRLYFAVAICLFLAGGSLSADETPTPTPAPGFMLEVEISGMFALVPSVDQSRMRIIGVRADATSPAGGPGHDGLVHRAHLRVPCGALVETDVRENCRDSTGGWEAVEGADLKQGFALSAGYDLVVETAGTAAGVVRSVVLGDYLVDLGHASAHPSLLSAEVDDEVRKRAVLRLDLERGFLDIGQLEQRRFWSIVTKGKPGGKGAQYQRMAGTLSWKIPIFATETVLELRAHAPDGAGQRIRISPPSGNRHVRVILSNEPTVDDFCEHEPNPDAPLLHHFLGFYQLVEHVPPPDQQLLPRYDGGRTYCGKPYEEVGGSPPRICQKPILSATWDP